jgi:4-diphosphocytidyl-2-C-methyl-D-erythritol kinase
VFAPCAGRAEAEALCRQRPAGVAGFVVQGLNRSPLLDAMSQARG